VEREQHRCKKEVEKTARLLEQQEAERQELEFINFKNDCNRGKSISKTICPSAELVEEERTPSVLSSSRSSGATPKSPLNESITTFQVLSVSVAETIQMFLF
tara:strand:- start:361 stop:666 length:306 start_codon:yes stop_codon:yes gene_type:complete